MIEIDLIQNEKTFGSNCMLTDLFNEKDVKPYL